MVLGHHVVDELAHVGLKLHIPVGDDADEPAVFADGHAGDLILGAQLVRLRQCVAGAQPEGVGDDAVLAALHHIHLLGLLADGHIFMDHTDAALTGQGDGHAGLGYRVHGRAHHRDIQGDLFGQPGVQIHVCRKHIALRRDEQHVVKGEAPLAEFVVPVHLCHIPSSYNLIFSILRFVMVNVKIYKPQRHFSALLPRRTGGQALGLSLFPACPTGPRNRPAPR